MLILDHMWESEANSGFSSGVGTQVSRLVQQVPLPAEVWDNRITWQGDYGWDTSARQSRWMTFKNLKVSDYVTFRNGKIITSQDLSFYSLCTGEKRMQ